MIVTKLHDLRSKPVEDFLAIIEKENTTMTSSIKPTIDRSVNTVEADVREFMLAVGQVTAATDITERPTMELIDLRVKLIAEEVAETLEALAKLRAGFTYENKTELLDGLCDIVYVTVGAAVALGLPFTAAWNEVQRSNMAKVQKDGTVKRREDGKILKPDGWTPPDLWNIVKTAHDEARKRSAV